MNTNVSIFTLHHSLFLKSSAHNVQHKNNKTVNCKTLGGLTNDKK